jgi:aminopeptidase N
MRVIFLSLFIFCFQFFGYAQSNIDVEHYQFYISVSDKNDSIQCKAIIYFRVKAKTNSIIFDLTSLNAGRGMAVKGVNSYVPYKEGHQFSHFNNKLEIKKEFGKGDTFSFEILYAGKPTDGLIISRTKYGHRSFFADNWPDRGHNWIPCHDDPADKATVEFIVTAPEHYQVVANGVQIEETSLDNGFKITHWKEDTPISTKVMVIGIADFAVNLSGVVNGCIPVYSWVYPEDRNNGFKDYAQAKEILEYYIAHVGPYGYKKLANVQSKTRFVGLENANTIFYAENSVTGTKKNEGLLAHEIAHQWFGNMATEKSFGHLWLSEGFATYFTILYFENKYGKDTAIKMLKEDREQVIEYSKKSDIPIVDIAETDYMKLLNVNSYQKGGWVLHMLRNELGDSVFWRSIKKYYATYAGGIADTRDLQKVFETVSGKNLKQFFDQWLYTPGQPDLEITWRYDATEKFLYFDVKQLQKNEFKFPLILKINTSSGSKKEKLFVDKIASSFKIKQNEKPVSIIVDPDTELLMSKMIKEK